VIDSSEAKKLNSLFDLLPTDRAKIFYYLGRRILCIRLPNFGRESGGAKVWLVAEFLAPNLSVSVANFPRFTN
jgi:hypothetical protein